MHRHDLDQGQAVRAYVDLNLAPEMGFGVWARSSTGARLLTVCAHLDDAIILARAVHGLDVGPDIERSIDAHMAAQQRRRAWLGAILDEKRWRIGADVRRKLEAMFERASRAD